MGVYHQHFMYDLHMRDLVQTEGLRQYADHVVKEIKSTCGGDTDIQIRIEPEPKVRKSYSISINVTGLEDPIVIHKNGKNILPVFRKARKAVMRKIRRLNERRIHKRRPIIQEQWAS